jgi:FtsZ-binding cell division protein ZapB
MNADMLSQFSTEELLENRNRLRQAVDDLEYMINEINEEHNELKAQQVKVEPTKETLIGKTLNLATGAYDKVKQMFQKRRIKDSLFRNVI